MPHRGSNSSGAKRTTLNLIVLSSSNAVGIAVLAFFWFLGARIVSKGMLGEIAFYLAVSAVASTIAQLGTNMGKMATYPNREDRAILQQFDALAGLTTVVVIVVASFLFGDLVLAAVLILSQVAFSLVLTEFMALRAYAKNAVYNVACRSFQLLVGLGAMLTGFDSRLVAIFYSAPMLAFSHRFFKNMVVGLLDRRFEFILEYKSLLLHFSGISIVRTAGAYLDKIIVGLLFGYVMLGEYQFIFQIYQLSQFLPTVVLSYSIPEKSAGSSEISLVTVPVAASVLTTILAVLLSGPLVSLLFPAYVSTVSTIWLVCVAIVPSTIGSTLLALLISRSKTEVVVLTYSVSLAVQYSLLFLVVPTLGLLGVGLALLGGQIMLSVAALSASIHPSLSLQNDSVS